MDIKKLAQSLHVYERRVLPLLGEHPYLEDLARASGLKEVEAMRALQWLENKKAVTVATEPQDIITLDKNGQAYSEQGLPERRFLEAIQEQPLTLSKLGKQTKLGNDELNICLGLLRKKGAIFLGHEKVLSVKITDQGKNLLKEPFAEEKFLRKKFPLDLNSLNAQEKNMLQQLKKRKQLIRVDTKRIKKATLTDIGKKLVAAGVRDENIVDTLTPQLLREGSWKGKTFRRRTYSPL